MENLQFPFGDFDLSKIGESLNNFSSNDYIIPDFLMVNHSEELDLSKNGGSVFIVFKPNLKRELAFRFIKEFNSSNYTQAELAKLLESNFQSLKFPTDAELEAAITLFEGDGTVGSTNTNINDSVKNLTPMLYNAPGFQLRLKIDDLYYNQNASNISDLNDVRAKFGLDSLVTSSSDDTLDDDSKDYITERPSAGKFKIETVSTVGSRERIVSNITSSNSSKVRDLSANYSLPDNASSVFSDLGITATPEFNETFDKPNKVYEKVELFRSSNSDFYEPVNGDFSILSLVTNSTSGTLNESGSFNTWDSSNTRSGFFKKWSAFWW